MSWDKEVLKYRKTFLILDVEQPLLQLLEFFYPSYINNVTCDGSFDGV